MGVSASWFKNTPALLQMIRNLGNIKMFVFIIIIFFGVFEAFINWLTVER